ncbi:nucleoside/nucleotide kinase family protein [Arthrobacter celericrescens]|uniref:nucleoside/nucleotide kinase family protein n=1 Tax=Arthrobacter celericrescens TaxID=2320851 RepID=UPI000EA02353|nr:nucleoside/nucleotide kinase family protein [Arthrobacter celericrescens]
MPTETNTHGTSEAAAFAHPAITEALQDLERRLEANTRVILGITGPPGVGKSTFATCLAAHFGPETSVVVPMDGFHLGEAVIAGTELKERKGAIDTFDVGGYFSLLQRLKSRDEDTVYAPLYTREIEEPIAASIAVPARIPLVITEGNYLLNPDPAWQKVRGQFDAVWYLELPADLRQQRLIARHVEFGKEPAAAEAWAKGSDEANARLIQADSHRADRILPWS